MSAAAQNLAQARAWLAKRLTDLGGGPTLVGVDVGQLAVNGQVGYGLRVYIRPEGIAWCRQYGFPGLLETPFGRFYVAVLQTQAGHPAKAADKTDPYANWEVKVSGTDLQGASVKYSGTDPAVIRGPAKVSGTDAPTGAPQGEFRMRSGAFGSTFPGFGGED